MPVIDYGKCSSCGLCVRVCKSFTIMDDGGSPRVVPDNGLGCIACGQCMAVCAKGAVTVRGRALTPADSFPLPPRGKCATADALENLFLARRSVREFANRVPEKPLVERMLSMAASAPMGIPPSDVGVVAVHGFERVQEFAGDIIGEFRKWQMFSNPFVLRLFSLFMKKTEAESMRDFILPATSMMIGARESGTDLLLYHAPVALLFHQSPYADPADGTIACTYAMIAAESLGLGTCMIGTVSFALNRRKDLKEKWGIPAENTVSMAMIMGHPAFRYARGIRRRFSSAVFR